MNLLKKSALIFVFLLAACDPDPIDISAIDDKKVYGIDISKHQDHVVNDLNVKDSLTFIICKATDGKDYIDPDFDFNWKDIRRRGLVRGGYHFFRASDNPVIQAEFFIQTLQGLDGEDLAPIVDVEEGSIKNNKSISAKDLQAALLMHLRYIERRTNRKPMIYTNTDFADKYLNDPTFAEYPLWLAEYSNNPTPTLPQAWKESGYKIWQKSQAYDVESTISDFDIFHGRREDLLRDLSKI